MMVFKHYKSTHTALHFCLFVKFSTGCQFCRGQGFFCGGGGGGGTPFAERANLSVIHYILL